MEFARIVIHSVKNVMELEAQTDKCVILATSCLALFVLPPDLLDILEILIL